jgi:hypothetical protein
MNSFRTTFSLALLALGTAGLGSCISPPDYPDTPVIEFRSLRKVHVPGTVVPPRRVSVDTLIFEINVRDGDGDLGLGGEGAPASDGQFPYLQTVNGLYNRDGYNFHIQPYVFNTDTDEFEPYFTKPIGGRPGTPGEYDGVFPRLGGNDDKPAPLKVEPLRYKLFWPLDRGQADGSFAPGQRFKFEISIKDRALHESNKIMTSVVTLGPS